MTRETFGETFQTRGEFIQAKRPRADHTDGAAIMANRSRPAEPRRDQRRAEGVDRQRETPPRVACLFPFAREKNQTAGTKRRALRRDVQTAGTLTAEQGQTAAGTKRRDRSRPPETSLDLAEENELDAGNDGNGAFLRRFSIAKVDRLNPANYTI